MIVTLRSRVGLEAYLVDNHPGHWIACILIQGHALWFRHQICEHALEVTNEILVGLLRVSVQ